MANNADRIWHLSLPDNWTPEGLWCVCITIPADQQYMDALTGALGSLTIQKTWARDPTRTGAKTVAKTWENALYINPFQVNTGCVVIPVPPIPDQAAADDAAAAVIQVFFQHIAAQINACATTLDACGPCVDDLFAELTPYGATEAVRGALSQLCAAMNGPESASRTTYETDCVYTAEFDNLRNKIADNPYDWLNKMGDWIFAWLDHTSSQIYSQLNTVAGLMGGHGIQAFVNDNGGIAAGGGAGFGSDCPWHIIVDFTDTPGEFHTLNDWADNGRWVHGLGWVNDFSTSYSSDDIRVSDIVTTFVQDTHITHVKVARFATAGGWEHTFGPVYDYVALSSGVLKDAYDQPINDLVTVDMDVSIVASGMRLQLISGIVHKGGPDPGGDGYWQRIELWGDGPKPWGP